MACPSIAAWSSPRLKSRRWKSYWRAQRFFDRRQPAHGLQRRVVMETVAVATTENPRLSFALNTDWLPVRPHPF
jgi:hypothetical protein